MWTGSSVFLSFMTLTFFKKACHFLVECPSVWICLTSLRDKFRSFIFGGISEMGLCTSNTVSGGRWRCFSLIWELLDHSIMWCQAGPLWIFFSLCHQKFLIKLLLTSFSIHDSCWKQLLLWWLLMGDFLSFIASTFISWHSTIRKNFLFSPMYLFTYIFLPVLTHKLFFYPMGYNLSLLVFICMFELSQIWLVGPLP